MSLSVDLASPADVPQDLAVIGVPAWSTPEGPVPLDSLPRRLGGQELPEAFDARWCRRSGFGAKTGQWAVLRAAGDQPTVVVLGLGERTSVDPERWRRAGAALVRAAGQGTTAALALPAGDDGRIPPVAEGAILAAYRYDEFRSEPSTSTLKRLLVVVEGAGGATGARGEALSRGVRGAQAASFARDLINRPPSDLTPRVFADMVVERFRPLAGVEVEVWEEHRIHEEGLGGLAGVARGSSEPPRLLRVRYQPQGARAHLGLVGKGITFDSGGLSLKTAQGMTTMKTDMSGAAGVLSATWAAADEGLPVQVTALAPIAENMPGGRALKPGDVLRVRDGSTVEVLNTDAEGRLVLADALCLAAEEHPDAIVDLATLTGAAVIALGPTLAALYATDDRLTEALRAAGEAAGERSWALPLVDHYREHLDSEVADVKNIGRPGQAGSIVAALFLSRFVGSVPWAHLDIAGPARAAEASGYLTKGGTGFGARTLLELLRSAATSRPAS